MVFIVKCVFFTAVFFLGFDFIVRSTDRSLRRIYRKGVSYRYRKAVEGLGMRLSKYFDRKEVDRKIRQAGRPFGLTPEVYFPSKFLLPVMALVLQTGVSTPIYWKGCVSLVSFFLPEVFLSMAASDRRRAISGEIPEVTDIFEAATAAGIDTGEVFRLAADFAGGREMKRELIQLAAGYAVTKNKEVALKTFRENIGLYDTDILSLALLQGDITGKTKGMLEALSSAQHDNVIAKLHREDKMIDYKVLVACAFMGIGITLMFLYPYFTSLSSGMSSIFD